MTIAPKEKTFLRKINAEMLKDLAIELKLKFQSKAVHPNDIKQYIFKKYIEKGKITIKLLKILLFRK
jgi:hypothetical protein